jgi:outer membrane usher protein
MSARHALLRHAFVNASAVKCQAVAWACMLCAATSAAQPAPPAVAASPAAQRITPLEITVNGVNAGTWPILQRDGMLYAPEEAFSQWRINRREQATAVEFRGVTYWPLASVAGFNSKLNFSTQSLDLTFSPSVFSATRVQDDVVTKQSASPALPSAFVNYDLSYTHGHIRDFGSTQDLGALTELGVSGNWGVLTSSYFGRNLLNDSALGTDRAWRRLETTYTLDMPQRNQTLRLGDAATVQGSWGRQVYFAGLQWGTNFALSPGYNAQALPLLSGVSAAPSTVELYVNDALRQVSKVPTGPFTIDNFPLVSGSGDARVVVRDVLGRETVLVQPFSVHQDLLAPGLSAWSAEAGALRRNLGLDNANYGAGFGSGVWRYGWSRQTTSEVKLEASRQTSALGLGLSQALPWQHLGTVALAHSHDATAGNGSLLKLTIEKQSNTLNYAVRWQAATDAFRALGDTQVSPRREASGNVTWTSAHAGTFGLAVVRSESTSLGNFTTVSANHSLRIGTRAYLSTSLTRVTGSAFSGQQGAALGVSLIVPMDNGFNLSASFTGRPGESSGYAAANQSIGADGGLGWRTLAGARSGQEYAEGGVYFQGRKGLVSADVQASSSQQTLRLGGQGGLVAAGGQVFATQRQLQSYAIADVADYADVRVTANGRPQGVTDSKGLAFIGDLSPYQTNAVRLNPQDLPISAELDSIEVNVVPPWRSAVRATFPVRSGRAALLRIVLANGEAAPAGAIVMIDGDKQEFFVARRGEAYVTGLQANNQLTLRYNDQSCTITVALPPGSRDDITRLGPLMCKGVTP